MHVRHPGQFALWIVVRLVLHFPHLMMASGCPTGCFLEHLIGAGMTRHYRQLPYSQGCYRAGSEQEGPCRRNVSRAIDSGSLSRFECDPFSEIM
jgi:hypothetical protein